MKHTNNAPERQGQAKPRQGSGSGRLGVSKLQIADNSHEEAEIDKDQQSTASSLMVFLSEKVKEERERVLPDFEYRSTSRFGAALLELITRLNCSQSRLATLAQVNPSQLSFWLRPRESKTREVGPNEVCRIAWAVAELIDNGRRGPGRGHLDAILNSLLWLAGYSSQLSYEDVIWRRKIISADETPKALRIGWFEWPPFLTIGPTGFAREVAEKVCSFFYRGPAQFVKIPMHLMSECLREREIDITAPVMMRFPRRLGWLRFSKPIPEIRVGFDAIFQTRKRQDILKPGAAEAVNGGAAFEAKYLNLGQIEPIVATGESTEFVVRFAFDINARSIQPTGPTGHAQDLIEKEVLGRTDKDKAAILFTNEYTVDAACSRLPNELMRLSDLFERNALKQVSLPFAFGVNPEEPNLLNAVDESIDVLTKLHYFTSQVKKFGLRVEKTTEAFAGRPQKSRRRTT